MAYIEAIRRLDPGVEVLSKACPLFVPIAEEGLEDDKIAYLVAEKYLEEFKGSSIDTLVMGCTHLSNTTLQHVLKYPKEKTNGRD